MFTWNKDKVREIQTLSGNGGKSLESDECLCFCFHVIMACILNLLLPLYKTVLNLTKMSWDPWQGKRVKPILNVLLLILCD
jgi:hypothetical protein